MVKLVKISPKTKYCGPEYTHKDQLVRVISGFARGRNIDLRSWACQQNWSFPSGNSHMGSQTETGRFRSVVVDNVHIFEVCGPSRIVPKSRPARENPAYTQAPCAVQPIFRSKVKDSRSNSIVPTANYCIGNLSTVKYRAWRSWFRGRPKMGSYNILTGVR